MQPESTNVPRSVAPAWGVLILCLVVVLINSAFTQFFAARFEYQSALGQPLVGQCYAPFAWIGWSIHSYENGKTSWNIAYVVSLVLYATAFLVYALAIGFATRRSKKHNWIHGTAHWATELEIRKTGLLPTQGEHGRGVYVGAWEDRDGVVRYLRHNGPEHIAAIAPTRSGKGVGLVIPTLLSWPHSAVIHDMKGELWSLTAGWRQRKANNKVLKFDPAAESGSCRFNPLQEVRLGSSSEVADVQNLVTIMVDPDGRGLNDHWTKTAHAFLTGVTLHLLYKAGNENEVNLKKNPNAELNTACLYDVAYALSDPKRPISDLYEEMLATKHIADPNDLRNKIPHPVVAAAARDMLNRPEQERGSVLSSAMSYLMLYRDPLVATNTARGDFSINDLMNNEKPLSLYLVVRPADKDRLKPLMRLLLNQIVRVLTREEMKFKDGQSEKGYRHRLLLMLDEFPSFGRLEVFQEALAFIAGYGIKAYLIMQDISQLRATYGHDESILSNCHIRMAYAPNKPETAKWLSDMVGKTTVSVMDTSTSGHRFGAVLQNVNQSVHSVGRALLTPDECMTLPGPTRKEGSDQILKAGDMLIFTAGFSPIYGKQILYFQDPEFSERAKIPAPVQTDRLEVAINTHVEAQKKVS
jgi:type IV secretion system protein VirD4